MPLPPTLVSKGQDRVSPKTMLQLSYVVTQLDETPERRSEYCRLINPHAAYHRVAGIRIYTREPINNAFHYKTRRRRRTLMGYRDPSR